MSDVWLLSEAQDPAVFPVFSWRSVNGDAGGLSPEAPPVMSRAGGAVDARVWA